MRIGGPIALALLLLGCAHELPLEPERGPGSSSAPTPGVAIPGVPAAEPGTAVLTVVWAAPSPRFAVACGNNLFDEHQHWLRGAAAQGSLLERFMIPAGQRRIQCFVADAAEFRSRWALFEDTVRCAAHADLRLELQVDKQPDGQLAFTAAYSGPQCDLLPARSRRPVAPRADPPPRICCGDRSAGEFHGE